MEPRIVKNCQVHLIYPGPIYIVSDPSRNNILGAIEEANRDIEMPDWCFVEAWHMIDRLRMYVTEHGFDDPNMNYVFATFDNNGFEYQIHYKIVD